MIVRFILAAVLGSFVPWCGASPARGVLCGTDFRCTIDQYCNEIDHHCRSCDDVCDPMNNNYDREICIKKCEQYWVDSLREEVQQLRTLSIVTITLTCLAMAAIVFLLLKAFVSWKNVRESMQRVLTRKWVKKATNNNKVQDDAEVGAAKQNGLKLSMPTISATVATGQSTTNSNSTPNTTSTPLSRRHPSEDTTLDYAYDNPAMTPSPEAAQLRTKRESSF